MIQSVDPSPDTTIIIESDICTGQYKSAEHFYHMQQLSDQYMKQIIGIYDVACHRKGEVDHIGGVAKLAICQEIACSTYFSNAEEVMTFLTENFWNKDFPKYVINKIKSDEFETTKNSSAQLNLKRVDGSSILPCYNLHPQDPKNLGSKRILHLWKKPVWLWILLPFSRLWVDSGTNLSRNSSFGQVSCCAWRGKLCCTWI